LASDPEEYKKRIRDTTSITLPRPPPKSLSADAKDSPAETKT
jgi:hypothetical protein